MFEKAKFGNLYLTRDGRKAVFIKSYFYPELNTKLYEIMIEDGTWISVTSDGLIDYETGVEQNDDIISKYKEDINEAELDEEANNYYEQHYDSANYVLVVESYKAGYRKAKEK